MSILRHRATRIIAFFTAAFLIAFSCSGIACVTAEYNRIYFDTKDEAEAADYRPCSRCKP